MSRTRIAIRVLLTAILLLILWIVGRAWLDRSPTRRLARAQAALDRGDPESARIDLLNVLVKFPTEGEGHRLMSQALLALASTGDQRATYVTHSEARAELAEAARLQPENVDLQAELLAVYLDRGELQSAQEVATALVAKTPDAPNVTLAMASKAVRLEEVDEAEQLLAKFRQSPNERLFLADWLAATTYPTDHALYASRRDAALATAVEHASQATVDQLSRLPLWEQLRLADLLKASIASSSDMATASQRVGIALDVCEKYVGTGRAQLAEVAGLAAEAIAAVRHSRTDASADGAARTALRDVESRAQKLLEKAIEGKTSELSVYRQAARLASLRRDYEGVVAILDKAIELAKQAAGESVSQELLELHLAAARNLMLMRRFDAMKPHLAQLGASTEASFVGWGELLSGGVASAEGRHETALNHYLRAEQRLGRGEFVEIALAKTYLSLGEWAEALPRLGQVREMLSSRDPEQQAWAQMHGLFEEQLDWGEFRAHLALDHWDEASGIVERLRGKPTEIQAEALAANYLAAHNQVDAALQRVESVRQKFPDDLTLRVVHARLLGIAKREDEGLALMESLAERDDLASRLLLANWRLRQGKQDDALHILQDLESRFPDNPTPKYLRAQILLASDNPREAMAIAQQLRETPETAGVGNLLALMQNLREQKIDEASEQVEQLTSESPSVTPGMSLLAGTLAAAQGDFASAVAKVGDTLDVSNMRDQARRMLLQSLMLLAVREGPQQALTALAPLLAKHPDDAFLNVVDADLKFKLGKFDEGVAGLDRVEQLLPDSAAPPYLKAAVWAQAGDTERAIEEVRRSLNVDERYVPAQSLAATLYLATEKFQRADSHASKALAVQPQLWQLYLVKAEALHRLQQPAEAMRVLAEAIEKAPGFLAAYRGLASLQLASNNVDAALATCERARQAMPQLYEPIAYELSVLLQAERWQQADELARQAAGDPPDVARLVLISQAFLASNRFDAALQWAEQARGVATEELIPAVEQQLGEVALRQGMVSKDRAQLAKARDHFATVVKSNPRHLPAGNNLAWLLATEFDQAAEAVKVIDQVRGDAPVAQLPLGLIDTLAVVYQRAGELERARELLEQANELYPEHVALKFHLGKVLAAGGKASSAVLLLEQAVESGGLTEEQAADARRLLETLVQGNG